MKKSFKTKSGTASFYIIAVTTLILTVVALSFVGITASEVARTTNNDLSNSAYDSALAGVEDAKIALLDYQSCLNQCYTASKFEPSGTGTPTCEEIIWYMQNPDCDSVGHILGRVSKNGAGEVIIDATGRGNDTMQQAYTCTLIEAKLDSYTSMLSDDSTSQLIPLTFDTATASSIKSLRISWYADTDGLDYNYGNRLGLTPLTSKITTPPTLSVQLIQTSTQFTLSQLEKSVMTTATNGQTDRGTLFFVATGTPTNNSTHKLLELSGTSYSSTNAGSIEFAPRYYDITSDGEDARITMSDAINFATANNKTAANVPILIYCPKDAGRTFACSASIQLPEPIGGNRNADSFMLLISLPFGGAATEVSIEACTSNYCEDAASVGAGGTSATKASFSGAQYLIDSTGRANNVFRRVKTLVDGTDIYYPFSTNAIELLSKDGNSLEKSVISNAEYNF